MNGTVEWTERKGFLERELKQRKKMKWEKGGESELGKTSGSKGAIRR